MSQESRISSMRVKRQQVRSQVPESATAPPGAAVADLWLGMQMRALRQGARLSLRQLADRAQVSVGMLSEIERGLASPSIRSLRALADALAVPVMVFFRGAEHGNEPDIDRIVRGKARRILRLPSNGVTKELVTPDLSGTLEVLMVTIEPGGSSGPETYTHKGEEAGLVLAGTLRLAVGGKTYLLDEGDSFRFASTIPHRFESAADVVTRVIWVMTPPLY